MRRLFTKKRTLEIMERFSQAKVLVVGDIMVDHFIRGRVARISPEAPVPVVDVHSDHLLWGGAANVMNNIHAMEGRVYGVGVVGDDETGRRLLRELTAKGIATAGIVIEENRPTTLKTRVVAHGQQVVRFDRESRAPVGEDTIAKLIAFMETLRDELGAVVISDYSKGVVTAPLLQGVRRIFAGSGVIICVDPKKNDFSLYRDFHIVTPNHHEAARAVGFEIQDRSSLIRAGRELMKKYGFPALLITRGEQGMSLFEKDGTIRHTEFPAEAREVFDVTGAGDTAIGVLSLALASGATFREAAFMANRAAGIAVGKVGTATVTRKELKRTL